MIIQREAVAGTLESSDIMITITKAETVVVNLTSPVSQLYGGSIRSAIKEVLEELNITGAEISAVDHGALDCTIRARMYAAAERACEEEADER